MVGTVTGVSFAITSVFSGLVIGGLGMGWAYVAALVLTVGALVAPRHDSVRRATPQADPEADGQRARWSTSAARSRRSAPCPACRC